MQDLLHDDLACHRVQEMRERAEADRRGLRLARVRRLIRRADRATKRAAQASAELN